MANAIELITKQLPLLDQAVKLGMRTSCLETNSAFVRETADANIVKIANLAMDGLADYSRADGFVKGDLTLTWQSYQLKHDRGRTFHLDAMDDEESMGLVFANTASEFIRTKVTPEIDAIRFAQYATKAGTTVTGTLDSTTIVDAIETAETTIEEAEFTLDTAKLFITPSHYGNIKKDKEHWTRTLVPSQNPNRNFGTFDEMEVIKVPQSRFYTAITLNDGKTSGQEAGGYAKAASGKNINFMIIVPSVVAQVTKHAKLRVFSPDVNQQADAYKIDYRIYHDAWVAENKKKGIYCHTVA